MSTIWEDFIQFWHERPNGIEDEHLQECLQAGLRAAREGLSRDTCPYRRGTLEMASWLAGWAEGEQ